MSGRFRVEPLETRDTPTTFTGPLGGTLTVASEYQNGAVVQSAVLVGPQGNTLLSQQGQFVVNPRTGEVTGTITAVGVNGNVTTGTLTGQVSGNTFTETTVFTGSNGGTWEQNGVYVGDGSGNLASATTGVVGPNGGTKSGSVTVDPTAGTVTVAGTLTGPNGRSGDWNRTVPV
jgi:hypothetical protein